MFATSDKQKINEIVDKIVTIPLIKACPLVLLSLMPLNDCQNKYPINVPKVLAIISSISKNLPANNCRNSIEHENTHPLNDTFL